MALYSVAGTAASRREETSPGRQVVVRSLGVSQFLGNIYLYSFYSRRAFSSSLLHAKVQPVKVKLAKKNHNHTCGDIKSFGINCYLHVSYTFTLKGCCGWSLSEGPNNHGAGERCKQSTCISPLKVMAMMMPLQNYLDVFPPPGAANISNTISLH